MGVTSYFLALVYASEIYNKKQKIIYFAKFDLSGVSFSQGF